MGMMPMAQPMGMGMMPMAAPQQQQQTNTTTIIQAGGGGNNQPNAPMVTNFPHHPVNTTCSVCKNNVVTTTSGEVGIYTWLMFCIMFVLG